MAFPRKKKAAVKPAKLWADSPEELKDSEDNVLKPKSRGSRATKSTYNGIDFDSQLEVFCYKELVKSGLKFEYGAHSYVLTEAFTCLGDSYEPDKRKGTGMYPKSKNLQKISYKPDFVGEGWIMETKGIQSPDFNIRWKLFKKYLTDRQIKMDLFMPHNHKEVIACLDIIKSKQ